MKYVVIIAMVMIFAWLFSGCISQHQARTTLDTTQFISSSVRLATTYDDIHNLVEKKISKFDKNDQAILNQVDINLSSIISIIKGWSNIHNDMVSADWSSITSLYEMSRSNYLLAREVINNNKDKFSYLGKSQLYAFDRSVRFLDSRYELMTSQPELVNKGAFIADAVDISVSLAKVLIPLIKEM